MENEIIIVNEYFENILYGNFKISTLMRYCNGRSPYNKIPLSERIKYVSRLIMQPLSLLTNTDITERYVLIFGQMLSRFFDNYYIDITMGGKIKELCTMKESFLRYMCIKKNMYDVFNPIFKLEKDEKITPSLKKRLTSKIILYQREYLKIIWDIIFPVTRGSRTHDDIKRNITTRQSERQKTKERVNGSPKSTFEPSSFKIRRFIKILKRTGKKYKK
jgi:hypothetical protein